MNRKSNHGCHVRVVLLESSRIVAQLFAHALKRDRFEVLYAGSSSMEAITTAARDNADVAIISAALDGEPTKGFDIARNLHSAVPSVRIISLLDDSTRDSVLEAFRSGARGLFCRNEPLQALTKCIVAVHKGQLWATNSEMEYVLQAAVQPSSTRIVDARGIQILSNREQQVVACVSEGLTNREIADRLKLSENTIKNYLFRIFEKLGISNRVELMMYAASQCGQLQPEPPCDDPAKAFEDASTMYRWCQEAAERFIFAPFSLGQMYLDGSALTQDKIAACMWFLIAKRISADVETRTRTALTDLGSELTESQLAEAKRKAAEWFRKRELPNFTRVSREDFSGSTAA